MYLTNLTVKVIKLKANVMKAIKIDVEKKEIYYVDVETKGGTQVTSIHEHLGCDCFCLGLTIQPQGDHLYVDDEGLLKKFEDVKGVFMIDGQPQPLAGNGLIMGCDEEGESQDVQVTIADIFPHIQFCSKVIIKPLLR